jgi:hypothetical protein
MKQIAAAIEHGVRGAKVNASSPKGEKGITKLIVRADGSQIDSVNLTWPTLII